MIDLNRPLEAVMLSGPARDIQLIPGSMLGTMLFVMLPVSEGTRCLLATMKAKYSRNQVTAHCASVIKCAGCM